MRAETDLGVHNIAETDFGVHNIYERSANGLEGRSGNGRSLPSHSPPTRRVLGVQRGAGPTWSLPECTEVWLDHGRGRKCLRRLCPVVTRVVTRRKTCWAGANACPGDAVRVRARLHPCVRGSNWTSFGGGRHGLPGPRSGPCRNRGRGPRADGPLRAPTGTEVSVRHPRVLPSRPRPAREEAVRFPVLRPLVPPGVFARPAVDFLPLLSGRPQSYIFNWRFSAKEQTGSLPSFRAKMWREQTSPRSCRLQVKTNGCRPSPAAPLLPAGSGV